MSKITALRPVRRGNKRINVYLDGKFSLSLDATAVDKEGLQIGQEISSERLTNLADANRFYRCLNAAYHLLSYRPRSEAELNERLLRRGFDNQQVKSVIDKLKNDGLVDDAAFARFWAENRETFSPRSQWLTATELRKKGVADNIISRAVGHIDEEDSAYRAAMRKARQLSLEDEKVFRRRLGQYLERRGFSYGVVKQALKRVTRELEEETN